jgi:hypothetical protein
MREAILMGLTAAAMLAAPAASAEETGRYVFDKSENGIVRLDTQTGEMSLCENKPENSPAAPRPKRSRPHRTRSIA